MPRRASDVGATWRRVKSWLFGTREDIDQEGLLAERTLPLKPRRSRRDEAADEPAPGERRDDTG